VSLLWGLGSLSERLESLSQEVQAGAAAQGRAWACDVANIKCRVGRREYVVWKAAAAATDVDQPVPYL